MLLSLLVEKLAYTCVQNCILLSLQVGHGQFPCEFMLWTAISVNNTLEDFRVGLFGSVTCLLPVGKSLSWGRVQEQFGLKQLTIMEFTDCSAIIRTLIMKPCTFWLGNWEVTWRWKDESFNLATVLLNGCSLACSLACLVHISLFLSLYSFLPFVVVLCFAVS